MNPHRAGDAQARPTAVHTLLDGLSFLEAPRWHQGLLWVSEIPARRVLAIDAQGRIVREIKMPGHPCGLAFGSAGQILAVSMDERQVLELSGRSPRLVCDLREQLDSPLNDMCAFTDGQYFIGVQGFDFSRGEAPRPGAIMLLRPDGTASVAAQSVCFPNGMHYQAQTRTLLVAETFASVISAFEVGADGQLSDRKVWAPLDDAMPDGIAMQGSDRLWVADPHQRRLLCVARGGQVLHEMRLEDTRPYACAIGGPQGRTLYVCCAPGFKRDSCMRLKLGKVLAFDLAHVPTVTSA